MAKPCIITFKGKEYEYPQFLSMLYNGGLDGLIKDGSIDIGKLTGEMPEEGGKKSAIQEQITDEGVLRQGRSEVGLQKVEPRDTGYKETAGKEEQTGRTPEKAGEKEIKFQIDEEAESTLDKLESAGVLTAINSKAIKLMLNLKFSEAEKQGTPLSKEEKDIAFLQELVNEGIRVSQKQYKELKDKIVAALKSLTAQERKFITPGVFKSIINQLGNATNEKKRNALLEYIDKYITSDKGARFKFWASKAKSAQEKIKDANKGEKGKFGNIAEVADSVSNIDLSQLTLQELQDFTKLANNVFTSKRVPSAYSLLMIDSLYGQTQKEEKERASKIKTIDGLYEYVEAMQKKTVTDIPSYLSFKRALSYARNRAKEIFSTLADTPENKQKREDLEAVLGDVLKEKDKGTGAFQKELDAFREAFAEMVIGKMHTQEVADGIKLLGSKVKEDAATILVNSDPKDVKSLDIHELSALNESIENLKSGALVPSTVKDTMQRLTILAQRRLNYNPALKTISKSKLWAENISRNMRNWAMAALGIRANKDEYQNLVREIASTQAFRIDAKYGNYSDKAVGKGLADIGVAINKANILKEKTDIKIREAYNKFKHGKRRFRLFGKQEEEHKWRKFIGYFLIEKRWQEESDSFNKNFSKENASMLDYVFNQNPSNIRKGVDPKSFDEDVALYNEFMDFMKKNKATIVKDGVEVIDIQRAQDVLFKDEGVKSLIETLIEVLESYKDMNEMSALYNGRSLKWGSFYFPYRGKGKGREVNLESISSLLNSMVMNADLSADSTHDWTEKKMYIETDPIRAISQYTEETRRNFFVLPVFRNVATAIKESAAQVQQEGFDESNKDNRIEEFGRALVEAMRDRLAMYYNTGIYRNESMALKLMERGVKKGLLAKPAKAMTEYFANNVRMFLSLGEIPIESWSRIMEYKDLYSSLIKDQIGDKYFSRWADEVSTPIFSESEIPKRLEKGADWLISIADTVVGKPLFIAKFTDSFKKQTGKDFDEDAFLSNPAYAIRYKDAIESASYQGLRKVEELFNNKNPMSNPQLVSFFGGLSKMKATVSYTRIMNFLMSFGRNEANQIADSIRKWKYGDETQRLQGKRDVLAILTSNFMYGILRKFMSIGEGLLLYNLFSGGDGDDKKYIDEQKQQLMSGKFYFNYGAAKLLPDLALGGSSNIYEMAATFMLWQLESNNKIGDDLKQRIYTAFDARYMQKIPVYGVTSSIFVNAAPGGMQEVIRDILSGAASAEDFIFSLYEAIFDVHEQGALTEKDMVDLINVLNLSAKYFMPNPIEPVLDRKLRQVLSKMRKDEAKQERIEKRKEKVRKAYAK